MTDVQVSLNSSEGRMAGQACYSCMDGVNDPWMAFIQEVGAIRICNHKCVIHGYSSGSARMHPCYALHLLLKLYL
jgi:hypothetical protein